MENAKKRNAGNTAEITDEPYILLAYCIIIQALNDLAWLNRKKTDELIMDWQPVTRREIETFFGGAWCELLLSTVGMDGKRIYRENIDVLPSQRLKKYEIR